ncbi:MAG TPA: YggS family pyridoxal phosphate-dependent enzyme [bacterium]|nr:YggS family pyridoxal phosphate-dependent enzyme [bacterium]
MYDYEALEKNVAAVRGRIAAAAARAGRDPAGIRLVAATKYVGAEALPLLARAGVRVIGENRVQDALAKFTEVGDCGLEWHFIGTLQKNKIHKVLSRFSLIHSVDSAELAGAVAERSAGGPTPVLFEVNVADEATKHGFDPDSLTESFPALLSLPGISPRGLMTMAPFEAEPGDTRPVFGALRGLRDELARRHGLGGFTELSMGMTNDFEVAVEEGATMVRVGSALFRGFAAQTSCTVNP